ncbi:PBP superfamily domain protein [Aquisphaera giovannonii]|uniref:PBP superfamily domain protein n=1 Tax=Aquisphaera giovannonii TaxID=406548 RepID=A0A5B9WB77_9BACT|nr:substrate-binding domain-containing protein [Aquisphaera giovannonii]QEH37812.1 PBP superfamily domain protein [Aquisphaera giovannonii]
MPPGPHIENSLRAMRLGRGWSQDDVARRSGLSRAGISAIETDRIVPSAAAALALADAFGCRVEDLFRLPRRASSGIAWAWPPPRQPARFWCARVEGRSLAYPVEATDLGVIPHDGVCRAGGFEHEGRFDPDRTLVLACCDPAVGLLAAELMSVFGIRLVAVPRSSATALARLGEGLVHVAGVHLAKADDPEGNARAVRDRLGPGYRLLRVTQWEEGIAVSPSLGLATVRKAVGSKLRWVGREDGSGARACLDELLGNRRRPLPLASDHRGVAEAIRNGWADLGVCLRLVSEEAGLDFLSVRTEDYDLCYPERLKGDPRIEALVSVVRSPSYRRALGELPGYDSSRTGEMQPVV